MKPLSKTDWSEKQEVFFEMWRMKRAIPSTLHIVDKNESLIKGGKEFLLQMNFMVPNTGIKSLNDLSSKDIYNIFNLASAPTIPSQRYWLNKLNRDHIDWDTLFLVNTNNKLMPRNVADFNFKCFHGLNRTGIRLRAMKLGVGLCLSCKRVDENLEHVLYECNNSEYIWRAVENILRNTFNDNSISISKPEVLTGMWKNTVSPKLLLMNVVISISKFHIWKIRNKLRYDFELTDKDKSIKILKWSLFNHISLLKKNESSKSSLFDILNTMERNVRSMC